MPAYTTQSDLEERYGTQFLIQLTDRADTPTGAIDADVVTRAIAQTEGLIDGYLAGRYALPLATVPDPIPAIAAQIAIYVLHVYEPNAKITRDYEMAIKDLDRISKGAIQLAAEGVAAETTGGGGAQLTDRERPFTETTMRGFI